MNRLNGKCLLGFYAGLVLLLGGSILVLYGFGQKSSVCIFWASTALLLGFVLAAVSMKIGYGKKTGDYLDGYEISSGHGSGERLSDFLLLGLFCWNWSRVKSRLAHLFKMGHSQMGD